MNLQELISKRAALIDGVKALRVKADTLTPDELKKIDTDLAEADALKAQIDARQRIDAAIASLDGSTGRRTAPAPVTRTAPTLRCSDGAEIEVADGFRASAQQHRFGAGQPFASEGDAYRSGMWLLGTVLGNDHARQWSNDYGYRCPDTRSLNLGSNAAGAVLAPEELSNAVIWHRNQYGLVAQFAQVVPMNSDSLTVPKSTGEVTVYAVGENPTSDVTASDPTFGNVEIVAKQWMGMCKVTRNLIADAVIDIAAYVAEKFGWSYAKKQDDAVFIGDGTTTYHNIVGLTAASGTGSIGSAGIYTTATNDDYAELTSAEVAATKAKLAGYANQDLAWYCSSFAYYAALERLMAAGGGNTMMTLASGLMVPSYMGAPVRFHQSMDATSSDASSKVGFIFGSLRQAVTLGQRAAFEIMADPYSDAAKNLVRLVSFNRWGVNIHDVGDSTSAGALVALKFAA
jgi:HK97 family phage major capsid protein